ncbi:Nucleoporin NUP170 [Golovinomyces cichoracearum]|uniref:Nucleoporin NUP170 n=1 Tax=Golovinomyces cichoracearum TaxID=62708 RepID=A0A420JAX2_9PEZI|nr:Nucleoporin NUP170 [Golovinomyces cichoracearum]
MAFPATPQKSLPGAFFTTPAPSRYSNSLFMQPPLFNNRMDSESVAAAAPIDTTRELVKTQTLKPVQRAAQTINDVLQREICYPDLDSYVRQGISSDYHITNSTTEAAWLPYQRSRLYDIPDKIFEQYNHAEVSTMMGLFAEINHAWVTIDNCIYLWDYTDSNPEIIGYEDQPNSITAVRLVVPRNGVFVSEVTYLLVLATTAEIILLGVSSKTEATGLGSLAYQSHKNVSLYATRMSLSIRGANVHIIEGSRETGRIFFTGKSDPSIYELTYQQEEKWFTNRCGKVNHSSPGYSNLVPAIWSSKPADLVVQMAIDDSRGLLYTLSSESTIRTFHLDSPTTLKQVIDKKCQECLRDISHMISQSPLLTNPMKICSISPISAKEGSKLHLMATTTTGCRLFLSATRGYGYLSGQGAPQSMQVQHIRFPPRIEPRVSTNSQPQSYSSETATETSSFALKYTRTGLRYPPGLNLFLITKKDRNGNDSLFLSGPETGRIAAQAHGITAQATRYFEHACWLDLNSHAEDIGLVTKPFAATSQPIGFGNELAVQFDEPCQEIAVLTNTGVHIIRRRRLIDIFATAIRNQGGDEGLEKEIKKFIRYYGRAETTATALAVACGQVCDVTPGDTRVTRSSNPETLEIARKCFVEYGGRPTLNENMVVEGTSQAIDNVRPSSRHEGLAIYMARLVRSVWDSPVINRNDSSEEIQSTVAVTKLTSVQEDLMKLDKFLQKNKSFIEGLAGPESLQRVTSQQEEIELQGEHQALHSLQKLNLNIIEGISFVKVLFEEGVQQIWSSLDQEVQQSFQNLTFEGLFSSDQGRELAKILVKLIVNRNIAKGLNVDTVADALRRRCGSFCSADDVVIFKAQEQLKKASEFGVNFEMGRKLLNESLKLFMQVAGSLTFSNLQAAARQFSELQFHAGAINLILLVAQESDRGNRALAWVNEDRPAADSRIPLYNFRKQCYDLIHKILEDVDNSCGSEPELADGKPTSSAARRNEARQIISKSDDELFQFDLYEWYLSQGLERTLLSVDSDYVVRFLTRSANTNLERADLLWKLYQGRENFYEAASVQLGLAKSDFPIPLSRRIEYLCRAKANASALLSHQTQSIGRQARQILQSQVTELLDVANIQDEVLHRLNHDPRGYDEVREKFKAQLDGQIQDLTVLYNDFASPALYFDICLKIYEAASHRNEADIAAIWQQLLDSTHSKTASDPSPGQLPYEAVITMVREMARRLSVSESTFSPRILIPMLERYAQEFQFQIGPRTWLPELFIEVGFTHETIVGVLQDMWYQSVAPFTDKRRRILSEHILYVIEKWYEECMRSNLRLFGSEEIADGVLKLLNVLVSSELSAQDSDVCAEMNRRIIRAYR